MGSEISITKQTKKPPISNKTQIKNIPHLRISNWEFFSKSNKLYGYSNIYLYMSIYVYLYTFYPNIYTHTMYTNWEQWRAKEIWVIKILLKVSVSTEKEGGAGEKECERLPLLCLLEGTGFGRIRFRGRSFCWGQIFPCHRPNCSSEPQYSCVLTSALTLLKFIT